MSNTDNLKNNAYMEGASSHTSVAADCVDRVDWVNGNNLSLMYFNARSLIPKFEELCLLVEAHTPDIICIVESWLCVDIPDSEVGIPGYQLFRKDRSRHGGGVLLYISDNFTADVLPSHNNLEFLPVVIRHFGSKFCVSVFYRPPNSSPSLFDTFYGVLASLNISVFSLFILLGDFNVNMNDPSHHLYHKVVSLTDYFHLNQVVSDFTHHSPCGSKLLIDLVFTSSLSQVLSCTTIPPLDNPNAKSYHHGLHVTINWKTPSYQRNHFYRRTIWRYAHADFAKANRLISETDWDALYSDDINLYCTRWQLTFLSIMEQCIPRKVLPSRRHNLPWLNKSLVQYMRRRNLLFQKAKKSCNPTYKTQYKRVRNLIISQLRQEKQKYFHNLNPSNTKQFWKIVKVLNKHGTHSSSLTHYGVPCSSDLDKANSLNDFFCSCFNTSCKPISSVTTNSFHNHSPDILCTEDEVCSMLKSLDTSKANGPDGISSHMLKYTADTITPSITKLFNSSIACCHLPSSWKIASVVPVPKVPKAKSTAEFRPISLLPLLSKVLERHFYFLICEHLFNFYPLSNCQWGFQPGKSTVSALLHVTHDWLQYLEKGVEVGAIFFDIKKAFDSVPHSLLLSKLEAIGLDGGIISWIHNYLADRHQFVVFNGVSSETSLVTSGVPQGSILGPLLFLIYMNDISQVNLSPRSKLVLYADDILLYHPISSTDDYCALQTDIDTLSSWTTLNKLSFNPAKCKAMIISRKRSICLPPLPLSVNGSVLEVVSAFKYLGLLISSDLSWSHHVKVVCSKARKMLGLLYRRYYQYSDRRSLLQLYVSLVRPHLDYAAQVWDPHLHCDIRSLESVQKFALRICSKQWETGYQELLDMFSLPSLENRRMYLKLCHLFKIIHGLCYFPPEIIAPNQNHTHSLRSFLLQQPFSRTNSFYYSFFPDSIHMWNNLPEYVVCAHNVTTFCRYVKCFFN